MNKISNEDRLSDRKHEILLHSIEDYIQNASPITSSAVCSKYTSKISTATLRNELNALEAMGYLKQLHTSGGRVPTSLGYRYYVNSMMADIPLDSEVLLQIHQIFDKRAVYLGDMVAQIADIVSTATNYPTVVMLKGFEKLIIKSVKIIPLMTGQALILIETNSGIINNFMNIKSDIPIQTFVDAGNFLTTTFIDKTVAEMLKNMEHYKGEMSKELTDFKGIFDTLVSSLQKLVQSLKEKGEITARGQLKLLNSPEYSDPEKAKKIIDVLSKHDEIKDLFTEEQQDVSFKIGSEIPVADLQECAVATADYQVNGSSIASIGIIGPQRMDYAKIASALKFVVGEFSNLQQIENSQKGEEDE